MKDRRDRLPIHAAFDNRFLSGEVVKYLADQDPKTLCHKDTSGRQPIHYATVHKLDYPWINWKCFEVYRKCDGPLLLGLLANREITNIDDAVSFARWKFPRSSLIGSQQVFHFAVARLGLGMIQEIAKLDRSMMEAKDGGGNLPLHSAAEHCNLDAPKFLLKERIFDVDVKNNEGMYPLFLACKPPTKVEEEVDFHRYDEFYGKTQPSKYNPLQHLELIWEITKSSPNLFVTK